MTVGKNREIFFSEEETQEIIRLYEKERLSYNSIAIKFGCSRGRIQKVINKSNVIGRTNKTKGNHSVCDENYFELIDNEEKAYWLGFIYGDGWISTNKKHRSDLMGLALQESDKYHIENFLYAIKSNHNIHTYKYGEKGYNTESRYSRVLISSDKIVSDLKKYGMIPNKSNKIGKPKNIDKKFLRHFIRGFFDADGSISLRKLANGKFHPGNVTFTKTPELLSFIEEISGFKWIWRQRKEDNAFCKTIIISKLQNSVDFLEYMYKDSTVYLQRKYDRYRKIS